VQNSIIIKLIMFHSSDIGKVEIGVTMF